MADFLDDDDGDDIVYTDYQKQCLEMGLPLEDFEDDEKELTEDEVLELQAQAHLKIFLPRPYNHRESKKIIAIGDTETDPFSWELVPQPFTVGFYDGQVYYDWWGPNCVQEYMDFLAAEKAQGREYIVYFHNGGKFDFHFFLKYMSPGQNPLIMGGRMVKIDFNGVEHRDSFSIIPQALKGYKKTEIDYANFVPEKREAHKAEIRSYQKDDCVYLYDLVIGFHKLAGDKLTIASAALPLLHSMHGFERITSDAIDQQFRQYFFGGRCQCFETGVLRPRIGQKFYVYDRNSMYPAVMQDELHPISAKFDLQTDIDDRTDFACIVAKNDGCLPVRAENDGLDFNCKYGTFFASIHEIKAGLDTGTLRIDKVKHAWAFHRKANFAEFVTRFYGLRLDAKAIDDKVLDILYKLILNSAYGKFALNPRKFKQWLFTNGEIPTPQASADDPKGWTLHSQEGDIFIWCRPNPRRFGFYNVATAASITGAARANLHRNLALAKRPLYCDTDSIICEGFTGPLDEKTLGGWKLEATGDLVGIAGKKLYCVTNEGDLIKKASKGVQLSPQQILDVCRGQEIIYQNPVPNFVLGGTPEFTQRRINKTG
jgi:hypothetical protein